MDHDLTGADRCAVPYWVVANLESDIMGAIVGLSDQLLMMEEGMAALIGDTVRAELAVELARLDVAVSTRLAASTYVAPNNPADAAIAAAVRAKLEPEISRLAACATVDSTGAQIAAVETA